VNRAVPVDTSWEFAPAVLILVAVYGWAYFLRWRKVRREHGPRGARVRHLVLWMTGLALLLIALVSPIDRMGEQMASAHMVQHLLLADLVPIALILGLTKILLRPVTRVVHTLERRAGPLAHPAVGVLAYVGAMCFWHIPTFYDAALLHPTVHVIEHLCFAAAGGLYWWHLISPIRSRMHLGGMGAVAYMASTKLFVGALGVLLTFLPKLLYEPYDIDGTRWGMTPLTDQSVAGAMMGLEQSLVMGIGLGYLFFRMLNESEREQQRAERLEDARAAAAGEAA
jgi:cytochrome c oxidase assembly factor CtaG